MKNTNSINSEKFFLRNDKPFDTFVWLGKDFVEIAVTNKDHTTVEVVKTFSKEHGNITRSDALEIFNLPEVQQASIVYIGLDSKKFVLVPNDLFNPAETSAYLSAVFDLEKNEICSTQKMVPNDCEVIYSLKRGTKKLIEQELDNVELFSADATLLIAYQQLLPPNKELQSFIRLMDNDILITIYKNKKLQLHQLYEIKNLDDALYFYLNALVTLGLNQKEIFASILGNHKDLEEYKSLLSRNIASVKFANRLPTLQYADEIFSYPSHSFFNLFALVLCA